jgi:8-oxo-dGTP pyrophosphatase MutT (NUDIX family)
VSARGGIGRLGHTAWVSALASTSQQHDDLLARLRTAVLAPVEVDPDASPGDAAVLILADPADKRLPVLFMRRTRLVPTHRGQIAFPGGGVAPGDEGVVGTALREAQEELGVDPADVEVLGLLPAVFTATATRRLTPVVALQRKPITPVPDPFEVADWFRVGLVDLCQAPLTSRPVPGAPDRPSIHFYEVDGRIIWGATAAIIHELLERLR